MASNGHRVSGPDRRRQILEVSAKLFARRGFRGTTTRQIAERAHVNEAILFRHFPRKEDLYWAILDGKNRVAARRKELEELFETGGNEQEIFAAIAEGILRRNTADSSLSRLLLFSALEDHRLSRRFFQTHVERYYDVLARHIREKIRAGTFRPVDPLLAARGFIGMVAYHFQIQELFGDRRYTAADLRRVCRTLAGIWVEGMRERGHVAAHARNGRAAARVKRQKVERAAARNGLAGNVGSRRAS
jgi:AcrR family transcriptional regulator